MLRYKICLHTQGLLCHAQRGPDPLCHMLLPIIYCRSKDGFLQGVTGSQRCRLEWPHECLIELGWKEGVWQASTSVSTSLSPVNVSGGTHEAVLLNRCLPNVTAEKNHSKHSWLAWVVILTWDTSTLTLIISPYLPHSDIFIKTHHPKDEAWWYCWEAVDLGSTPLKGIEGPRSPSHFLLFLGHKVSSFYSVTCSYPWYTALSQT